MRGGPRHSHGEGEARESQQLTATILKLPFHLSLAVRTSGPSQGPATRWAMSGTARQLCCRLFCDGVNAPAQHQLICQALVLKLLRISRL